MHKSERIQGFVEVIWEWFAVNKRDLPWRDLHIRDLNQRAYRILVSEIMLQQTQVSRVKIIYRQFLERFSSLQDLARASNKEVILAWRGMGYNSRALRLRDAAREIVGLGIGEGIGKSPIPNPNPKPIFPRNIEGLMSLPGIGHYTAAAIRNFAFDLPTPCVDTNIRRILHRAFVGPENADGSWKKDDGYLLKLAGEVLEAALADEKSFKFQVSSLDEDEVPMNVSPAKPETCKLETCKRTSDWHSALMDFGSLVCTKRNPKWDLCPLTKKGLMKAAYKLQATNYKLPASKPEPGRYVGSQYIPNRIFRGKVVDELRDEPSGLALTEIGRRICIDWSPSAHRKWLAEILHKLESDQLIKKNRDVFVLGE